MQTTVQTRRLVSCSPTILSITRTQSALHIFIFFIFFKKITATQTDAATFSRKPAKICSPIQFFGHWRQNLKSGMERGTWKKLETCIELCMIKPYIHPLYMKICTGNIPMTVLTGTLTL